MSRLDMQAAEPRTGDDLDRPMLTMDRVDVELDAEVGIVRALDALSLSIERGETFALVGESGCGKSMTALALMRLLPENGLVTAGDVVLDEPGQGRLDILDLPESQMRSVRGGRIGMIFQEPSTSLNPVMRVGDQIVEAIEAHTPLRGAEVRAKAIEWLRRVGIPEPERRIDDYPFRMSGGQKQRVMIAMTLSAEPELIVADEPTTALDVTIQAQILDLLKDLQRERKVAMMLITHDLAVVSGMAQRVALMYAGQIVEVAPAREFFAHPRHPYARALLRALPDASRRGQPLQAIAGTVPPLWLNFEGCRFAPRCPYAVDECRSAPPALERVTGGHEVRCIRAVRGDLPAAETAPLMEPATRGPEASVSALLSEPVLAAASAATTAQATQAAPLLDVQHLRVRFPIRSGFFNRVSGYFDAVDDVSLSIQPGQTLALVGESGCGKTTTGKAIAQLLRRIGTIEGKVLLQGQDLNVLDGEALMKARSEVQVIFQDPFASLDPRMRVAQILDEGMASLMPHLSADERHKRMRELVDQVGLRQDALDRYPHEFSGGQRQRIAIARALAVQPRLVICDEPTSALDVSVQAQILNLLRELQAQFGLSYLFITHNIGVVEVIADRVVVMQKGKVVESGDVAQVLGAPREAYTRRLLESVPRLVV